MVQAKFRSKKVSHPGYRKCGAMVYSDARKALLMAKSIKSLMNVEFKNHDIAATTSAITITPVITQLTNIAQGDTTLTRDGSSVKFVSISFRYTLVQHASATSTFVRIMLVLDRQTNEAIYTDTDLLADVTVADAIVSPRNLDNGHRFRVLYDKVHAFSASGSVSQHGKFYKKLQLKVRYDAAAALITSLTQSSLSLFTVATEASSTPTITHRIRLRYVDN